MKKISLLCVSLLFCPFFLQSMKTEKSNKSKIKKDRTFAQVVQNYDESLSLPNKDKDEKLSNSNNNITISSSSSNKQDESPSLENVLNHEMFNDANNTSNTTPIEQNNHLVLKERSLTDDNNQVISIEGSSPVDQQRRSFFGKLFNSTKSYRDLALDWLKSDCIDKKWRDQAQNDIKWAITEENKAVKRNRNGNEDFVAIFQAAQKNPIERHTIILQMLDYLKKNEDNMSHIDKFVHADGKGLPFDTAGLLEDTYKTLETEKKHDLFVLALITQQVQQRVLEYQKTCNYIYNMTKDNKNVVGVNSTDNYSNPSVLFKQSQDLMSIVNKKLLEKENK